MPGNIYYSRRNDDGTFAEKQLIPVPNYFVVCDPCGDLTTWSGSLGGGGGTSLTTGSTYPITASWAEWAGSASWAPGSTPQDVSVYLSSSWTGSFLTWASASTSTFSGTASFAITASYFNQLWLNTGSLYPITASWAVSASWAPAATPQDVSEYLSSSWTGSFETLMSASTSQFAGTSSHATTASYYDQLWLITGSSYPITASWAVSASWAPGGADAFTVMVSAGDTTPNYLENKIQAGPNIYISKSSAGGDEILHISSSAAGTSVTQDVSTYLSSSWTGSFQTLMSASTSQFAGTSSYATTASYYAQLWLNTGSTYPITASWAISASWAPMDPYFSQSVLDLVTNVGGVNGTYLVSGGEVAWVKDYTYAISPAEYYILGTRYTSSFVTLSLDPGDVSLDRIDIVSVTTSSAARSVQGTISATPVKPDIDYSSEIELTFVYVAAGSTSPSGIQNIVLYREGVGYPTEWSASVNAASIDISSSSDPYSGSFSIEATSAGQGDAFTLYTSSAYVPTPNSSLWFYIKSKAAWSNRKSLRFGWFGAGSQKGTYVTLNDGQFGFDSSQTSTYQGIIIPLADFAIPDQSSIDTLEVEVRGSGGAIGWFIDDVTISQGLTVEAGTDELVKVSATDAGAGYLENKLIVGPNLYVSKSVNSGYERLHISASTGGGTGLSLSTGSTYPITSSWAISASWAPTSAGNFFAQGGNAFAQSGSLGLTDDNDLSIIANNTERMRVNRNDVSIYTTGSYSYDANGPVTPTLKLYDAAGDKYAEIRGRLYSTAPNFQAAIGIGNDCFVSSSDSDIYATLAFGNNTLVDHRGGDIKWNIGIGHNTMIQSDPSGFTACQYNTVIGHESLPYLGDSMFNNVILGYGVAENNITTASSNIWSNVFIGVAAVNRLYTSAIENTVIGEWAGYYIRNGSQNTLVGAYASQFYTQSNYNTALGWAALEGVNAQITFSGSFNTAIGASALGNANGSYNTSLGYSSAGSLRLGSYNIAIGVDSHATPNATGPGPSDHIITIGYRNFYNQTRGMGHIAIGSASMWKGSAGTSSIGIGNETFRSLETGTSLIGLGNKAGEYIINTNNAISNSIALGHGSHIEQAGEVVIGSNVQYTTNVSSSLTNFTGAVSASTPTINALYIENATYISGSFSGSTDATVGHFSGSENGTPIVRTNYWFLGSENLNGIMSGSMTLGGFINGTHANFVGVITASAVTVNGNITVNHGQNYPQITLVRPGSDAVSDLGSTTRRWKDIHFSGVAYGSASFAVSASWAPGGSGTSLTTGSTYPITASWAISASGADDANTLGGQQGSYYLDGTNFTNVARIKTGLISGSAFGGDVELTSSVVFSTPFDGELYSITITGEDPRTWYWESKTASGFVINSNSSVAFTGIVAWQAIYIGEY